jgi:hypothetical protein
MLPGDTENLSGKRAGNPASSGPSSPGRKPLQQRTESVQMEKRGKIPSFPDPRRPSRRLQPMFRTLLKSKIHRARVTHCELHYEGSLALEEVLVV